MTKALIALHFQNDTCHTDGKVAFSHDRAGGDLAPFLKRCRDVVERARDRGWLVVHVHIAFAEDYSDLQHNCTLFRAVAAAGAVKRGTWGAAPVAGLEPREEDLLLVHQANNAFHGTGLDAFLKEGKIEEVYVMGLATQFSVDHTVRHACDLGYAVSVISDCCGSADGAMHAASIRAMSFLSEIRLGHEIEM